MVYGVNSSVRLCRRPGLADVVSEAERGGEGLTAEERGRVFFMYCNKKTESHQWLLCATSCPG